MLTTHANPKAGRDVARGTPRDRHFISLRQPASISFSGETELAMAAKNNASPREGAHLRRRAAQARPVGRAAVRRRYPLPHHPLDPAQYPDHRLRHGHGDRGRRWRSPWRRPAASASSTAISSRTSRPAQVRQVKKFESGMVVNPLTIEPGRDARRGARPDEGEPHFRHPGGRRRRQRQGRQAGRHPDQPRRALRHRSAPDASPS